MVLNNLGRLVQPSKVNHTCIVGLILYVDIIEEISDMK